MSKRLHLLVDISAHGLGHLAQTAPVISKLREHRPDLSLTVRSALPRDRLSRRIAEPYTHIESASDFGFVMHNAVDIDYLATEARYRKEHANWTDRVATEEMFLRGLKPDLVLANAAYLPLIAAKQAGIPALGMCSLNWADLFLSSFGESGNWAHVLHREIFDAYNAATLFLRITPGLPMADFRNRREIGPIATLADPFTVARTPGLMTKVRNERRDRLAAHLALDVTKRWLLVAMGGMDFRLPLDGWPELPNTQMLCPKAWNIHRPDVRPFDPPGHEPTFLDLLSAVDVVLTKSGYGTFVEAACNGTAVLYVPRDGWEEEEFLVQWLRANARCETVERTTLLTGEIAGHLDALQKQSQPPLPFPVGTENAFQIINEILQRQ